MTVHIRWFIISCRKRSAVKNIIFVFILIWAIYLFLKLLFARPLLSPTPATILITNKSHYQINLKLIENHNSDDIFNDVEWRQRAIENKIKKLAQLIVKQPRYVPFNNDSITFPYYNVHIFYYAWYGNINFDSDWHHWNHNYIPHWKKGNTVKIYRRKHEAPLDIGSNYYPLSGCYSSRDPETIKMHMRQLKFAGIGTVVVSWAPPGMKDSPNDMLSSLFYYANEVNIKITLHIEPYHNRDPNNLQKHLIHFFDNYINHPALYKVNTNSNKKPLPLIYVYDSYLTPFSAWKELLSVKGNISIRHTKYDAIFIGLIVDQQHRYHIKKSHFDGFYTYFASNGFTYGSTWKNWNTLAKFARQNRLIFIPSVGPGYVDTQVRPWNSANMRHRRHGQYYDVAWRSAMTNHAPFISITSFNEWHEGTQIEPAQAKSIPNFTYLDYNPEGPDFYLNLTKWWVSSYYNSNEKQKQ